MKRLLLLLALLMLPCSASLADVPVYMPPAPEYHDISSPALYAFAADHLPEYTLLDGRLFPDTAMLLVQDGEGLTRFVGGLRTDEGWQLAISTALPEGTKLSADTYEPEADASLGWTRTIHGLGAPQKLSYTVIITPQADGRWLVTFIQGWGFGGHVVFGDGFVHDDVRYVHGELLISTDITQVQWLALPTLMEDAVTVMDTSNRAILAEPAALLDAPGGTVLAQYNPGTFMLILAYEDGWVQVAPGGGAVNGWMTTDGLLIGSQQIEGKYLAPYDCPVRNRYGSPLDVYLLPSDDETNPLLIHLNTREAQPVYEMGVWGDIENPAGSTWTQIYDPAIPGGTGFVRTEQLDVIPEWGLG